MEMWFEAIGFDEMEEAIKNLEEEANAVVGRVLYQKAEDIMARSKAQFVPVEHGDLRDSGHVLQPTANGGTVEVVMAYGGPAAPYAAIQHENMEFHHTTGGPKYLERPLLMEVFGSPSLSEQLGEEIMKEAQRGARG